MKRLLAAWCAVASIAAQAPKGPEYLVYVDVWDSWGERQGGPELAAFLSRLREFMDQSYDKVGVLDIGNMASDVWGDAAKSHQPHSSKMMEISLSIMDGRSGNERVPSGHASESYLA